MSDELATMAKVQTAFAEALTYRRGRHVPLDPKPARTEIHPTVRQLVRLRDDNSCQWCLRSGDEAVLHLDHIVPHSSGGSDSSDNLRMLCDYCNLRRSNRVVGTGERVLPVSEVCFDCQPWIPALLPDDETHRLVWCATHRGTGYSADRWIW